MLLFAVSPPLLISCKSTPSKATSTDETPAELLERARQEIQDEKQEEVIRELLARAPEFPSELQGELAKVLDSVSGEPGSQALGALLSMDSSEKVPGLREDLLARLKARGNPEDLKAILSAIRAGSIPLSGDLVELFGEKQFTDAVPEIKNSIDSSRLIPEGIGALARMGGEEAESVLRELAANREHPAREEAFSILPELKEQAPIDELYRTMAADTTEKHPLRLEAIRRLGESKFTEENRDFLRQLVATAGDEEVRKGSLHSLAKIKNVDPAFLEGELSHSLIEDQSRMYQWLEEADLNRQSESDEVPPEAPVAEEEEAPEEETPTVETEEPPELSQEEGLSQLFGDEGSQEESPPPAEEEETPPEVSQEQVAPSTEEAAPEESEPSPPPVAMTEEDEKPAEAPPVSITPPPPPPPPVKKEAVKKEPVKKAPSKVKKVRGAKKPTAKTKRKPAVKRRVAKKPAKVRRPPARASVKKRVVPKKSRVARSHPSTVKKRQGGISSAYRKRVKRNLADYMGTLEFDTPLENQLDRILRTLARSNSTTAKFIVRSYQKSFGGSDYDARKLLLRGLDQKGSLGAIVDNLFVEYDSAPMREYALSRMFLIPRWQASRLIFMVRREGL